MSLYQHGYGKAYKRRLDFLEGEKRFGYASAFVNEEAKVHLKKSCLNNHPLFLFMMTCGRNAGLAW